MGNFGRFFGGIWLDEIQVAFTIMREIRRRTRVVGNFPDGNSALMLVTARLRYVAGREWGQKRYINMQLLIGSEGGIEVIEA